MEFPLLRKELLQQSGRARTYIIRALYATVFYFCVLLITAQMVGSSRFAFTPGRALLGQGKVILWWILNFQFAGIYLVLPALASSSFTVEKERQTLLLLLLTRLRLSSMVLEKYLSRVWPMVTCVMLSLPVLGFIYSFGGTSELETALGTWLLILTVLQVAAVATFCSIVCRTTPAAFLLTYLLLAGWSILPLAIERQFPIFYMTICGQLQDTYAPMTLNSAVFPMSEYVRACFFPPALSHFYGTLPALTPGMAMYSGIPILIGAGLFLLAGMWCVRGFAFVTPRNRLLGVFQWLDAQFQAANKWVGNINIFPPDNTLPEDEPIAWRETNKRSYGQKGNMIRLAILLEAPLIALLTFLSITGGGSRESMQGVTLVVWLVVALVLCANTASLLAVERSRNTLEVLLTTPISSLEIIRQKMVGTRRLMLVCSLPLITCLIYQAWWMSISASNGWYYEEHAPLWLHILGYLAAGISSILVYFPLICWISIWRGVQQESGGRSVLSAMGFLAGCCLLPYLVLGIPLSIVMLTPAGGNGLIVAALGQFSPLTILIMAEFASEGKSVYILIPMAISNSLLYLLWLRWIINRCLNNADRLLGRIPNY